MFSKKHLSIFLLIALALLLGLTAVEAVSAQDQGTAVPESTAVPGDSLAGAGTQGDDSNVVFDRLSVVPWQDIAGVLLSVAIIFLIAFYGGKMLYVLLQRLARRTETTVDNELLEVIRPQITWLILALGFQFATNRLDFLSDDFRQLLQTVYFLLYLFVITATVWRVGDFAVDRYMRVNKHKLNENLVNQMMPLMKRSAHIVILIVAGAILAGHFGVDVLAISAALGLSGFALALAAKDTITNVISGFVLMVSQPFKVGDRIDVSSLGSWGEVTEIGMRSTTVVMRDNRMVIVPNSAIVDNTVVNYSRPDSTYRLQSDIGLGAAVDIPKIQEMIKETVHKLDGVLPDKPVDIWFIEFADSSNTFRVRWWVKSYSEKRRSTDMVNTAIQELASREGINMPNPIYTLENKVSFDDDGLEKLGTAV